MASVGNRDLIGTAPKTLAGFRAHPIVAEVSDERNGMEDDGIWVYFVNGYCYEGEEHCLHGANVAELREQWELIEVCNRICCSGDGPTR